ncbi:MAG: cell division protein ZapE [Rickettsiales bacterium]|jgi:cell division protein ZapE
MTAKKINKTIILDPVQEIVAGNLTHLGRKIIKVLKKSPLRIAIKNLFVAPKPIKSLYIYGKVGRGKSMLMQDFFKNLPTTKKAYFHFNNFMQAIHKELHKLRKDESARKLDLIALATKKVVGDIKILCFDEMQVEDVADAMILQGVFNYFVSHQIAVVTTSNCHPLELYENGLQRNLFVNFVNEVLLKNFLVLNLDGKTDYRGEFESLKKHYFSGINLENKKEVAKIWDNFTKKEPIEPREIVFLGRKILVKRSYQNIASFDFEELCGSNLGVADYEAITAEFKIIFLLNVPILKPENRNEAKRLIWFIDEAYEKQTQLIVLAEGNPEELYVKGIGFKAFKRTASRLSEV